MLERTPDWIRRKYIQALREQHEDHRKNILEAFKGIALLVDSVANKGKGYESIMPLPFDEMLQKSEQKKEEQTEYIEGEWWLSE